MTEDDPLSLGLAGLIPPPVALARLALAGCSPSAIEARLAAAAAGPATAALRRLLASHRERLEQLADAAAGIDHTIAGTGALAALRAGFDRAVAISPEASVAAYTLADPALLGAATAELVDWLARLSLHPPLRGGRAGVRGADVLDLGCGIGRVAAALAPRVHAVLGLDIAAGMIAEASQRHGAIANLRFATTDGTGLALPAASADLILAVDTFPYLVQAGVAEKHVADAARVLREQGALIICNLSYRGVPRDRGDARRWSATYGFTLTCDGEQPFRSWDGAVFVLQR